MKEYILRRRNNIRKPFKYNFDLCFLFGKFGTGFAARLMRLKFLVRR